MPNGSAPSALQWSGRVARSSERHPLPLAPSGRAKEPVVKTVALYLRVSTGEQTVENQRRELMAAAERRGWQVVAEFSDEGVSGANGRDKRPGFDRLHRAIIRRQ